jgi:hypothetical protein
MARIWGNTTPQPRIITARPASNRLRPQVARAAGHAASVVYSTVVRSSVRCASQPPRQIGGSKRCGHGTLHLGRRYPSPVQPHPHLQQIAGLNLRVRREQPRQRLVSEAAVSTGRDGRLHQGGSMCFPADRKAATFQNKFSELTGARELSSNPSVEVPSSVWQAFDQSYGFRLIDSAVFWGRGGLTRRIPG